MGQPCGPHAAGRLSAVHPGGVRPTGGARSEAPAVTFEGESLNYGELDEAANQLANLLAVYGAAPGKSVALMVPRSADAIVAILAVLKTGAAYLPIDPSVPAARLEFMLGDAKPVAAVTTGDLRSRFDGFDLQVVEVDDPAVEIYPSTTLLTPSPDDIAYMIYTSGTPVCPRAWRSHTAT